MIKKTITYILVVIALVYCLHWFITEGLRKNKQGLYDKYNSIFLKHNSYNALIIGSSRAEMHTDVNLLDSITGLNTFNAGVSGATTRVAYVILKSYTEHSNIPHTLFFECDFHISHLKTDTIYNFSRYFPYLSNASLYSQTCKIDKRFFQFKYNPFFSLPFMGINSLSPALHGWLGTSAVYDKHYKKGFFENTVNDSYGLYKTNTRYGYIHPETRQYLDSIILFAAKHHCQLVFTMSPTYKNAQKEIINKDQIIHHYQDIAYTHHIPFFNYSDDTTIVNHKQYFEDNYHMLYTGARIFTKKIATDFNNIH